MLSLCSYKLLLTLLSNINVSVLGGCSLQYVIMYLTNNQDKTVETLYGGSTHISFGYCGKDLR